MKRIKITIECTVTDFFYNKQIVSVKNDIKSGTFQREMQKDSMGGIKTIKSTYFEIQNKPKL